MSIDVTGVDLVTFVQAAYDLSVPQGLGFIHARSGSLSTEEAKEVIAGGHPVNMDYVHGRSVKLNIIEEDEKWTIGDTWYDHTDATYDEFLVRIGRSRGKKVLANSQPAEHGCSCACESCVPDNPMRDPKQAIDIAMSPDALKVKCYQAGGKTWFPDAGH